MGKPRRRSRSGDDAAGTAARHRASARREGASTAAAVPILYAALWESVAAHARLGLNVVVDVGLYDIAIAAAAAQRLEGIPVLFVGVRCDLETIMQRRRSAGAQMYVTAAEGGAGARAGAALAERGTRSLDVRPRS